jgi:non-heme Fe2+,alpha-ketoglutarate-dependent halogenase
VSTASGPSSDFSLTEAELAGFRRNGFAGPFKAYEPEEMRRIWKTVRLQLFDRSHAIYDVEEAVSGSTNISNYDRHLDVTLLGRHVCRPEIVHRVRSILGPDVLCWRTEFFPKYPGDEGTDWHQAATFANASGRPQILWPEGSPQRGTLTVWTAFTEATEGSGCLQLIPGTHERMFYDEGKGMNYAPESIGRRNKDGVRRGFFGYDYRELQIDPDWRPDESKAVSMEMRPGQFLLFWSTLLHASLPHRGEGEEMRLGYAARYVPTQVRIYPDTAEVRQYGGCISLEKYGAVLVCGRDEYRHTRVLTKNRRGEPFSPGEENSSKAVGEHQ